MPSSWRRAVQCGLQAFAEVDTMPPESRRPRPSPADMSSPLRRCRRMLSCPRMPDRVARSSSGCELWLISFASEFEQAPDHQQRGIAGARACAGRRPWDFFKYLGGSRKEDPCVVDRRRILRRLGQCPPQLGAARRLYVVCMRRLLLEDVLVGLVCHVKRQSKRRGAR